MSMDHKPEDEHELNRIHKAGGKVTCEGRVNGGLNLSRALGMFWEITKPSTMLAKLLSILIDLPSLVR